MKISNSLWAVLTSFTVIFSGSAASPAPDANSVWSVPQFAIYCVDPIMNGETLETEELPIVEGAEKSGNKTGRAWWLTPDSFLIEVQTPTGLRGCQVYPASPEPVTEETYAAVKLLFEGWVDVRAPLYGLVELPACPDKEFDSIRLGTVEPDADGNYFGAIWAGFPDLGFFFFFAGELGDEPMNCDARE